VEAESGTLSGDATVHRPPDAWTGESLWSGGAGVRLGAGGSLRLALPIEDTSLVLAVVELAPGAGTTRWTVDRAVLGTVRHGDVGPQGDSPAPGLLAVRTLDTPTRQPALTVTGMTAPATVDAVLVQPVLEWLTLAEPGSRHGTALVRSMASTHRVAAVPVPGAGRASVTVVDSTGRILARYAVSGATAHVLVPPGGFAIVRR
jgi:hypothetical protein